MALCPAHDDRTPSLSVSEGSHGKALAKCFAGCKFEDIRDALGLTPPRNSNGHAPSNPLPSRAQAKSPPAPRPLPEGAGTQIWVYDYHDGTPAFAVERRDPGKHFKQWTPAPDHLWIPVGLPAPRPLYQLQAILESESPVLVVEGEGCADAAQDAWPGMVVTTWSGGAASWRESEWYVLARIHRWTGMDGVRTAEGGEGVTGAMIRARIWVDGRLAGGLQALLGAPMAAYSGCGERDGGIGHGKRRSRTGLARVCGDVGLAGGSVADGRRQAGSGMARSRARARLNCSSQGQRRGRCRVNRRAERVIRPAKAKTRRLRVLVVTIC